MLNPEFKSNVKKLEKIKIGKIEFDEIEKKETNNVNWKLKIKSNTEIEIPFLYTVSWPSSENIISDY